MVHLLQMGLRRACAKYQGSNETATGIPSLSSTWIDHKYIYHSLIIFLLVIVWLLGAITFQLITISNLSCDSSWKLKLHCFFFNSCLTSSTILLFYLVDYVVNLVLPGPVILCLDISTTEYREGSSAILYFRLNLADIIHLQLWTLSAINKVILVYN